MKATSGNKVTGAKAKVTGMKAKSSTSFVAGKDPKKAITGNKLKGAGVDMPMSKGAKPMMKTKSKMK